MQSGEVTERVVGYLDTPRKTGRHLMEATETMIKAFNARTQSLIKHIGIDNVPDVRLSLKSITNLAVDGANLSKDIMINLHFSTP